MTKPWYHRRVRRGFTLIELLLVVSIIALLASMMLPAVAMVRDASRGTVCANSMRQLGLATFAYMDDNEGLFPDYWDPDNAYNHAFYPQRFFHNLSGLTWNSLQNSDPYLTHLGYKVKRPPYFCMANPVIPDDAGVCHAWTNYAINSNLYDFIKGRTLAQSEVRSSKALYTEALAKDQSGGYYRNAGTRWSKPWMDQYPIHRQNQNVVFIDGHTQAVNVGIRTLLADDLGFWFNDLGGMQQTWFWPLTN